MPGPKQTVLTSTNKPIVLSNTQMECCLQTTEIASLGGYIQSFLKLFSTNRQASQANEHDALLQSTEHRRMAHAVAVSQRHNNIELVTPCSCRKRKSWNRNSRTISVTPAQQQSTVSSSIWGRRDETRRDKIRLWAAGE